MHLLTLYHYMSALHKGANEKKENTGRQENYIVNIYILYIYIYIYIYMMMWDQGWRGRCKS